MMSGHSHRPFLRGRHASASVFAPMDILPSHPAGYGAGRNRHWPVLQHVKGCRTFSKTSVRCGATLDGVDSFREEGTWGASVFATSWMTSTRRSGSTPNTSA